MGKTTPTIVDGARSLLNGERYGFAIDATTADTVSAAYVGAPYGGTVAVHADNVTDKPNIPLDAAAGLLKGASPLVQSGTSAKMVHFPTSPYVRWSPHNVCFQSQTFDDAFWTPTRLTVTANDTTAPDGTSTADKILETTGTGDHGMTSGAMSPITTGFAYTTSLYVKSIDRQFFQLYSTSTGATSYQSYDLTNVTLGTQSAGPVISATIVDVGNGWRRISHTALATGNNGQAYFYAMSADNVGAGLSYTGDAAKGYYVWGYQVNRGPIATPYLATTSAARMGIPQSYDTAAAQYGILVEPAATNLTIDSERLELWNTSAVTPTADSTTAPNGATTAEIVTVAAGSAEHRLYKLLSLSSGVTHTFSIYAKQTSSSHRYVQLDWQGVSTTTKWVAAVFDLQTGTVTETPTGADGGNVYVSSSINAVGDGWYRLTLTAAIADTTPYAIIEIVNSGTPTQGDYGAVTWTAAGTESVYFWGVQVEVGSIATSYIPTLGSTVTRAGDQVEFAHASWPFSTTAETIYMDLKDPEYSAGHFYSMMGSGAPGSPILLGSGSTVYSGTEISWLTPPSSNTRFQGTSVHKSGDNANSAQGGAVQTNSSVQALATNGGQTGFAAFGSLATHKLHVYRYVVVPRRVTDADLPTWRYEA